MKNAKIVQFWVKPKS